LSENIKTSSVKESVKESSKILQQIQLNPTITIPELSEIIGITRRSIERNLRKLQQQNILKRIGGRKYGIWEIVKQENN